MASMGALVVLMVVLQLDSLHALPSGAPEKVCTTMVPGHGVPAQSSDSPFILSTNVMEVEGGEQVPGMNHAITLAYFTQGVVSYTNSAEVMS